MVTLITKILLTATAILCLFTLCGLLVCDISKQPSLKFWGDVVEVFEALVCIDLVWFMVLGISYLIDLIQAFVNAH